MNLTCINCNAKITLSVNIHLESNMHLIRSRLLFVYIKCDECGHGCDYPIQLETVLATKRVG